MSLLLVITGPPGSGKSTVARLVVGTFERSVLVEGDRFFNFLARDAVLPWLPGASAQNEVVQRAAAAATGRFVGGGYATVYDGVVGAWHLPEFAAATGLDSLHYVVLLPSAERCAERVAAREGHGFKDRAATLQMHREFSQADIDPRHVLVDPPEEVDAVVKAILERVTEGSLLYRCEDHG